MWLRGCGHKTYEQCMGGMCVDKGAQCGHKTYEQCMGGMCVDKGAQCGHKA